MSEVGKGLDVAAFKSLLSADMRSASAKARKASVRE